MEATHSRIQAFIKFEAGAGLILMGIALLAMLVANSGLSQLYDPILSTNIRFGVSSFEISKPGLSWINDALMAIFSVFDRSS